MATCFLVFFYVCIKCALSKIHMVSSFFYVPCRLLERVASELFVRSIEMAVLLEGGTVVVGVLALESSTSQGVVKIVVSFKSSTAV